MKKLLLGLSLCLLPSLAHAQEINPQFKMPCEQVVRLGFDKYFKAYGKATNDLSTAGMKDACYRYADCKRKANRKLMATLPTVRRQRLNAAKYQLTQFEDALWGLTLLRSGGGTMYGLLAANTTATREDWLDSAIRATKRAQRSSYHRTQSNRNWAKVQSELKRWQPLPPRDLATGIPDTPRLYREDLQKVNIAAIRLQNLLAQLPDEVSALLAQRALQSARHSED